MLSLTLLETKLQTKRRFSSLVWWKKDRTSLKDYGLVLIVWPPGIDLWKRTALYFSSAVKRSSFSARWVQHTQDKHQLKVKHYTDQSPQTPMYSLQALSIEERAGKEIQSTFCRGALDGKTEASAGKKESKHNVWTLDNGWKKKRKATAEACSPLNSSHLNKA